MIGMRFLALFKKIDQFLDRHTAVLVLWALIIILRLPNFFEPYWYGDEAIYLTLGNALREGERLYTTIIDHKTPLIYYLAMVPNQFYFRLLNLFWMLAATTMFFFFAKKLFARQSLAMIASLVLVTFTTLPWLEGHIPNGELFVLGFVLAGALLFSNSSLWRNFFADRFSAKTKLSDDVLLLGSGAVMGLGVLTKVPALLDVAGFLAIAWLIFVRQFFKHNQLATVFLYLLRKGGVFFAGVILSVLLSVVYFVVQGQGQDYLDYGLLYNFRYSQSWSHDFGSPLVNFLFSLPGKTLFLFIFVLLVSLSNQLPKRLQFTSIWFMATLYSVLLSSRPYPHYFIQMVPPFALLVTDLLVHSRRLVKYRAWASLRPLTLGVASLAIVGYVMLTFNFGVYSVSKYYGQFYRFATLQIDRETYENSFDRLVADNRRANALIQEMGVQRMFIWGTNPLLYAQSQTIPTSRFTVAFHIKDFDDHERTFAQIVQEAPKLIIVMNNEADSFPALNEYLAKYYIGNHDYQHMVLYWRKANGE